MAQPHAPYYAPGELPPPGTHPQYGAAPVNPYGHAGAVPKEKGKFPTAIVAIFIAGLLVIGGTALVYFKFLKKTPASGPQGAIVKYFEVLPTGDVQAIKALFAPDAQPSEANLEALKMVSSLGASIKYENAQMETLTETATDASVHLKDLTISVSMGGQSAKQQLSTYTGGAKLIINLKKVNGLWLLVASDGKLPNMMNLPGS
ncbi:MAG: hypothetical protein ACYC99_02595 [Candidatus Geothermincolia bacterium]